MRDVVRQAVIAGPARTVLASRSNRQNKRLCISPSPVRRVDSQQERRRQWKAAPALSGRRTPSPARLALPPRYELFLPQANAIIAKIQYSDTPTNLSLKAPPFLRFSRHIGLLAKAGRHSQACPVPRTCPHTIWGCGGPCLAIGGQGSGPERLHIIALDFFFLVNLSCRGLSEHSAN